MSKKKTISDLIKWTLTQVLGGNEADWKRQGTPKQDAEGLETRVFENKKTGVSVTAAEQQDGQYNCETSKGEKFNFSLPLTGSFSKAAADPSVAEQAADKIVEKLLEGEDISNALIRKAGDVLATRFIFAVGHSEDMEGFYAIITPAQYWQNEKVCFDQPSPIDHLLPKDSGDTNDCGTWEFTKSFESAAALRDDLSKRGFVWDEDFQKFIDRNAKEPILPQLAGASAGPASAVDQVMQMIEEGNEDDLVVEDGDGYAKSPLFERAIQEGLVKQFSFMIRKGDFGNGDEFFAVIYPAKHDSMLKCPTAIRPLTPGAEDEDDCMETLWRFPVDPHTPGKIILHLQAQGFTWDQEGQKCDTDFWPEVTADLEAETANSKPKRKQDGPRHG